VRASIWDQYNYSYGSNLHVDNGAPFVLDTTLRGSLIPNVRSWKGTITHRIGIDLHPIDLRNEEERKWLQALIWPEHHDRVKLFNQAASLLTSNTITRHVGNCVEILPHVANDIPSDSQLVIYHTSTAYQFSKELDAAVKEQIRILSGNRRIFHLSGESCYSEHYQLDLSEYNNGELVNSETLAYCDSHGKWIEWKIAQ